MKVSGRIIQMGPVRRESQLLGGLPSDKREMNRSTYLKTECNIMVIKRGELKPVLYEEKVSFLSFPLLLLRKKRGSDERRGRSLQNFLFILR